jgi:hypothetical protein
MRNIDFSSANSGKRPAPLAGAVALALVLAGCSSGGNSIGGTSGTGGPSLSERFASLTGASQQAGTNALADANKFDPADCPPVDIRPGTSTLTINAAGRTPETTGLRYQGSITQTARECSAAAGNLTIRVGVQGRLLLGPAGGSGQVDMPVRFALVQEGVQPKTIWTKLYRIPVTVESGQSGATFTHVEEDLTVPKPSASMLEAYVIYIGFDPLAAAPQPKRTPARSNRQVSRN